MLPPSLDTRLARASADISPEIKEAIIASFRALAGKDESSKGFENDLFHRLNFIDISVVKDVDGPTEASIVVEITVESDMLNADEVLHGGCIGLMVDAITTIPLVVLSVTKGGDVEFGVSQSMSIHSHSPALLGDKLYIVSKTLSIANNVMAANCEIWNETRRKLVASGTHHKMIASPPRQQSKL